jgi:hypothetical protein
MRQTGWIRLLAPVVAGRDEVTEAEALDFLVENGRAINEDWKKVLCHCFRAHGFKLRRKSRVYVRRPLGARATEGGVS